MASPGGASSEQDIMDHKKRKRMLSNRESARRSRVRKQQHLDDLMKQVGELRKENDQITASLGITNQLYLKIEAENAVLRTQMAELTNRLESLNEIINYINSSNYYVFDENEETQMISDCGFFNSWNQPIMASANMMMY